MSGVSSIVSSNAPSLDAGVERPQNAPQPLRELTELALRDYFKNLNGHTPVELYDFVMREVELPLFRAVMDYTRGNQSRAADILGINRGTLRKKLKSYGLMF